MNFTPTPEQNNVIRTFRSGDNLAIEAGAGTGKTSTLKLLGEAAQGGRGQYVAFNKAIVTEASEKMPRNVNCATAHSLAFRGIGRKYAHRLNSGRMKSMQIARMLRIDPLTVSYGSQHKPLSVGYLAGLTMRAVTLFCQSADLEPERHHVPYIDGIDVPTEEGRRSYGNNDLVRAHLLPYMRRAWADLMDPQGQLPYKHEHYLKAWQLSNPHIPADFIMFDECQDASPVMLAIVTAQTHAQLVFVGDSQQQIYGFTGAVNALDRIREMGGETEFLTRSFRFGPEVARVANGLLTRLDAKLRLEGSPDIASVVGPILEPDVILTRTNAVAVRTVLEHQSEGKQAALVGGGTEVVSFARAAKDLKADEWTSHPDLACFTSWGEVQDYVENDPQGSELALLVALVDEFGEDTIITALANNPTERDCDVVVSTAHKAKGREWNKVKLADDFFEPRDGEKDVNPDELRLMYVACTRAKQELDVTLCPQALRANRTPVVDEPEAEEEAELTPFEMTLRYGTRQA